MITAQHLTTDGLYSTASSYTTASISPAANNLVIITIETSCAGGGNANTPTVSGAGMTFTAIDSRRASYDASVKIFMFRGMSATPSTGVITIDFGGQNQNGCSWSISQFAGVDTSGVNGAGAVVQSASNDSGSNALTVTLAAFASASNATFGVLHEWAAGTITKGANFTESANVDTNIGYLEAEWANNNQTSVNWTWTGGAGNEGIAMAIEIKAGTAKPRVSYFL